MKPDVKIWDDFRKGESYALSYMYFQNVKMLYSYGKKFTSDNELVKDTIQDMFFDLIKNRNSVGETDNITFYLMTSFRRKLYKKLKQNNKLELLSGFDELSFECVYSAEQELINKESLSYRDQQVKAALSKLSPKQREILFYKYSCDFSYEKICEIMNLQYDSARKQVHRAHAALKELLNASDIYIFFSGFFSEKK